MTIPTSVVSVDSLDSLDSLNHHHQYVASVADGDLNRRRHSSLSTSTALTIRGQGGQPGQLVVSPIC